ncbi:MAG TPA: alpha/beta fold hydrolase [Ktedonobacteraceae bacterium]|nr:alpha/beta fold hydrolase [Ktedonobacteraceae bacterium]
MVWFISILVMCTLLTLLFGYILARLGRRFIREFTRPGMTVEQGTAVWGGWTFPEAMDEPDSLLQRPVTFRTADGVLLRGTFWAQRHSAPTIIISHGFHLPSRFFRSVAALEYAHGANVFLFDYRGHGESSLVPTTCGNAELKDLLAAIEIATSQIETISTQVYIHGFSMGAAVALLLPPHAGIAGIIADSAYARLDDMIHTIMLQIFDEETAAWRGLARKARAFLPALCRLTLFSGRVLFHAHYRQSLIARPDRRIGARADAKEAISHAPILLIHAENDPLIALRHAHRLVALARAAGRSIEVYYTPCAIHCGSYGHNPQQYMTLLRTFTALGEGTF